MEVDQLLERIRAGETFANEQADAYDAAARTTDGTEAFVNTIAGTIYHQIATVLQAIVDGPDALEGVDLPPAASPGDGVSDGELP